MTTAPRLTIDLAAIAANWQYLTERSPNSETAAVVKANAYGIGIEQAVPILVEAGCRTFFVAMVEEGIRLRKANPNVKIYILNGVFSDTIAIAIEHALCPVLSTPEQIAMWIKSAKGRPCAIHVDTGMNRLGLSIAEANELAGNSRLLQDTGADLLMSHLACADEPKHSMNAQQYESFREIARQFKGLRASLANSAAILSNQNLHFGLTRPGIAMYGGEAIEDAPNPMQVVVKAEARILQVRNAKSGEAVGYGAVHTLQRDSKIAICSAGYADGFHRSSSGSGVPLRDSNAHGGHGFLRGLKIPVLGRVSMDLTAFDVTDVPEADLKNSKWIELFGPNILIDDAARAAGTIGYELLTGLGTRYARDYVR